MAFYNILGYLSVEKSADKQRNEQKEFLLDVASHEFKTLECDCEFKSIQKVKYEEKGKKKVTIR